MRTLRIGALTGIALLSLLTGCAWDPANEGDCNGRIRFQDVLYRLHNEASEQVPVGKTIGTGDIVGCGGMTAPAVDRVEVRRIKGLDVSIAVVTTDEEWRAVFIAEDVAADPSSWPKVLER